MKVFAYLLILLLALQGVFASDYYFSAKQQGDKILVTHFISSDSERNYSIILPQDYVELTSNLNYTILEDTLKISGIKVRISYLQEKTDFSDSKYYFAFKINATNSDRLFIDFFSDEGYVFDKNLIFPASWTFISDESSSIASFVSETSRDGNFLIVVEKKNSFSNIGLFLTSGIILLAIIVLFYYFKKRKNSKNFLLDSEKQIVDFLKNSDRHEAWQRKIQEVTGFSKAKVSRLIRDLEARGLVEKIPMGNTNKVKLR